MSDTAQPDPSAPPTVMVSPLGGADAAGVQALAASLRRYFSPADLRAIAELLRGSPTGWVARGADGALAGFLLEAPTPDPTVREVAWMGVAEPLHGRGIGSRLLARAVEAARGAGMRELEV